MKPDRRPPTAAEPASGFYALAKAHVAAHGGQWFVIERRKQPAEWRAWVAYRPQLARFERLTVPTKWPLEFDLAAPEPPLADPPISLERRKQLAAMLRSVVRSTEPEKPRPIGFEQPRSPAEAEISRRYHEARLEELKQACREPPAASANLRRSEDNPEVALTWR